MNKRDISDQSITLPLDAFKCLYRSKKGGSIVCEIDLESLETCNNAQTIDGMVSEARLEYYTDRTRGFEDTDKLMEYLNS